MLNALVSDISASIKNYEEKFKELKLAFTQQAIVHTNICVSQTLEKTGELGAKGSKNAYNQYWHI